MPVTTFLLRLSVFLLAAAFPSKFLSAAQFSEIYGPQVMPGQYVLDLEGTYYSMWEKGNHGSASFGAFYSRPHTAALNGSVLFAPAKGWDLELGYGYTFPQRYDRPTEGNAGTVTSYQRYFTNQLQDFTMSTRYRWSLAEVYLDVLEKRNKTKWDFAVSPTVAPVFFNYFFSHYEDVSVGVRWLQGEDRAKPQASWFAKPLLSAGQSTTQLELRIRNGRLDRWGPFDLADDQNRYYTHRTHEHFTPGLRFDYGIMDNAQFDYGFMFTSPLRYGYDFRQYKNSGPTSFMGGTYTWDVNIEVPVGIDYRPTPNWDVSAGTNYKFIRQSFDYWEKAENGTLTQFPSKKLKYFNITPRLDLAFITTPAAAPAPAVDILGFGKDRLAAGQWKFSMFWLKDLTILRKNTANGAQNIVDPYNVYLYPVENYVAGTEYAAFFSGNNALSPANVSPQDYIRTGGNIAFGVNDRLQVGLGSGFQSESRLHQFSLNDKSDRYFVFRPYVYVDTSVQYRLGKSSVLSLDAHVVPDYRTELITTSNPQSFNSRTTYFTAVLAYKRFF